MNWLDKCRQIIDTESGRVLLYRDEVEAVLTAGDTISRHEAISRAVEIPLFGKMVKVVAVSELKALPSAQPEQRWIPCGERLPEDGKEVYVTSGKGQWAYTTEGKFSRRFGGWVSAWDNGDLPDVVAWMPLPEPYKERQEE
jgi:hypothetical protein